ncbi:hypothetical protein TS85_23355 [Sphingomonas hengshuiensis]|uniref:Lipoprotein n=2 Tax=Sphingomonas hengshuiensis TaxID=1609977 RepID=A0A7U5BF43_9SPHN|nr:hypothetical protein TS85_23355 [Sphingomonas hengshuiensis]
MRRILSVTVLLALAGCAAVPEATPPAQPVPVPVPAPPPPPPAPVLPADWRDWPLTPGDWAYRRDARGSIALFGIAGQDAALTLRCDRQRGRIYVSRLAAVPVATSFTLRTSSMMRTWAMTPAGAAYLAIELPVRDPALDAMGYSRGRFVVEGGGQPPLVVPAWPEILRVAEDCRG